MRCCHCLAAIFVLLLTPLLRGEDRVDYARDIRPLLSDRCYTCHGPDAEHREADLRLDQEASAKASAIVAGRPDDSEVVIRILSDDPDLLMPPPSSKMRLTDREKSLVRRWIAEGATWAEHWSFVPLQPVPVPTPDDASWPKNEIDRFVLARLEQAGVRPAAAADRVTLIRRLSFDLTGLPPTIEELEACLADEEEGAYERLVDRLLASERFGERMTTDWLDVARYADTYGYQNDRYRDMWPWRDWVIRAFNDNLPYDQFITWQLAGDLLPDATRDQILATAFNRNHRQTNEGGSVEEEFRIEYVADRVNTFGAAFLGLTLECCRCHDHKYDPITTRDYYQLSAFFDNIDESGLYSHFTTSMPTPTLTLADDDTLRLLTDIDQRLRAAEQKLTMTAAEQADAFVDWLDVQDPDGGSGRSGPVVHLDFEGAPTPPSKPVPGPVGQAVRLTGDDGLPVKAGNFTRHDPFSIALWLNTPDVKERAVVFHRSRAWTDAGSRGYELLIEEGRLSTALIHFWPGNALRVRTREAIPTGEWLHVAITYDGSSRAAGLQIFVNGQPTDCETVRDQLTRNITGGGEEDITIGERFRDRGFTQGLVDEFQVYDRQLAAIEVAHLFAGQSLSDTRSRSASQLGEPGTAPDSAERQALYEYFLRTQNEPWRAALAELRDLRRQRGDLFDATAEIMVMRELPETRPTHLLKRGAYDSPAELVQAETPVSLKTLPASAPRNRLGLAHWLTDPDHPLTARVAVNRFWQMLFGRGLVATPEDFGRQGQPPTHPELLDWLALSLRESGWDVKGLLRTIVLSATYRQSSDVTPDGLVRDPENILLARGPSFRLPAEMIRDGALHSGDLLVERIGGPPVKPYQPPGLWEEKSGVKYERDMGEGSHRRSLYTYWKRTSPPPSMMTFDASTREVCIVRRQATATPLQVLVLLNDPQYVEAARALAQQTMLRAESTPAQWVGRVFRTLTSRTPTEEELTVLNRMYEEQFTEFMTHPSDARALLSIGDHPRDETLDMSQLAALTAVAGALMNHDETVIRR